jgi:hypothetical protein
MTFQEFMPHWKKYEQCFEQEKVGMKDIHGRKKLDRDGKPEIAPWPHDKPIAMISYENFLKVIVDPSTNEYFPARNKDGSAIKGTTAKHIVNQVIRVRRKDGSEVLYSQGRIEGYDAMGNRVHSNCAGPEKWRKTLFDRKRIYDPRTNSTITQTVGTLGSEEVYEMRFNEKNLKELVSLRENDSDLFLAVTDEQSGRGVSVRKESNLNKTLELFLKPFNFLFNAEYISPQQRAELRQQAIDRGDIAPSTPLGPTDTGTPPPKGTYS